MFLFKRYKIRSYEMGLLFKSGEFKGLLAEGTHWLLDPLGRVRVEVVSQRQPWAWRTAPARKHGSGAGRDQRQQGGGEPDRTMHDEDDRPGDKERAHRPGEARRGAAKTECTGHEPPRCEHEQGREGEPEVLRDHESNARTSPEARKLAPSR